MKNLLLILFVTAMAPAGFGQEPKDTIQLNWANNHYKYIEYYTFTEWLDDSGVLNGTVSINESYYDKMGNRISKERFIELYSEDELSNTREERDLIYNKRYSKNDVDLDSKKFEDYIKKADTFSFEKKYNKAIEFYKLALEIKPNEEYPKLRLKELGELK